MPKADELDFIYIGPLKKVNKNTIMPQNGTMNPHKPHSVFWTSPVNPETGLSDWEEWCNNEDFRVYDPQIEQRLHIVPKKDCRILTLLPDSPELEKYTISSGSYYRDKCLDFEAIAKDYDALYVPKETVWKHNHDILNAWDVATCIFLAPKFNVLTEEQYQEYKKNPDMELNQSDTHSGIFDPVIPKDLPKIHPIKRLSAVDNSKENLIRELKALRLAGNKEEFDAFVEAIESSSESDVTGILKRMTKFHKFKDFGNEEDYHDAETESYNHAKVLLSPTVLKTCLKHGLVPDNDFIKNITSYHSLKYSYFHSNKQNRETQKLLLQYGAEPNIEIFDLDLYLRAGGNPNTGNLLFNALENTIGTKTIEMLLSAGADPEAVNKDGKSALEIAKEDPICYSRVYKIKYIEQAIQQKREKLIRDLREKMQKSSSNETKREPVDKPISSVSRDFTPDM
jgi:hypothetical protein